MFNRQYVLTKSLITIGAAIAITKTVQHCCNPFSQYSAGMPEMLTALRRVASIEHPTANHGIFFDAKKKSVRLCCSLTKKVATIRRAETYDIKIQGDMRKRLAHM